LQKGVPSRDRLIIDHAGIVPGIAANIVWKRCPKSPSLINEVAAFGVLALFLAADRYDHGSKASFATYARYWIDKYCRLYLDEIIGSVPRTGHMGVEEEGDSDCGHWVVDKPRRSVMDLLNAALVGTRLYRGNAAGGMAVFDGQLMLPGPNPGDKEIDVFSTEGPTREYLQRHVGVGGARFIWPKKVSREVVAPWLKPNPLDDVEFTRGRREDTRKLALFGEVLEDDLVSPVHCYGPSVRLAPMPAEVCYLAKQRTDRQSNSYAVLFGLNIAGTRPVRRNGVLVVEPKFISGVERGALVITPPPIWTWDWDWDGEHKQHIAEQKRLFDIDPAPLRKEPENEIKILRRAGPVQGSAGASRRHGRGRAQSHDEPQRVLPAGVTRKTRA
jgi:hypothetical protein